MRDEQLTLLLLLLAASARRDDGKDRHEGGLVSRVAARATGTVVDFVDPDAVLDKIDVNALMDRVDVNALIDRVDVNALIERVDVERLMERIDLDAIIDRVDVEEIVNRAGIADIVKESTGALAGGALDIVRRQLVALDKIVGRAIYRLVRRDPATRPKAPEGLEAGKGVDETGRGQLTGHYAGPVTRALALGADVLLVWVGYLSIAFGMAFVIGLFVQIDSTDIWVGVIALAMLAIWTFLYFWFSFAIAGKTVGMAIIGLRVLTRQGAVLSGRQAAVRTLVEPISAFIFGLGFIGAFTSPERRTLHDAAAGSVVVYDWGDRPAEMPAPITSWLDRHDDEEDE